MPAPLVVKFGGELLEDARPPAGGHGGDVARGGERRAAGHRARRRQGDRRRAEDRRHREAPGRRACVSPTSATLEVVVAVLAGAVNTRLVAALTTAGTPGGRTDWAPTADAVVRKRRRRTGRSTDAPSISGRVGIPSEAADMRLLTTLTRDGFVPVLASIGLGADGRLFNVNADTFAGHLAARLGATAGHRRYDGGGPRRRTGRRCRCSIRRRSIASFTIGPRRPA